MADDNHIIKEAVERMHRNLDELETLSDEALIEACDAFDRTGITNLPQRAYIEERRRRGI